MIMTLFRYLLLMILVAVELNRVVSTSTRHEMKERKKERKNEPRNLLLLGFGSC